MSLAGLILNFAAAIPLMTVTDVAGLTSVVLAEVHPIPATAAGYAAHLVVTALIESTIRLLDVWPCLAFRVPLPSAEYHIPAPLTLAVYYAAPAGCPVRGGQLPLASPHQSRRPPSGIVSTPWCPSLAGLPSPGWMRATIASMP